MQERNGSLKYFHCALPYQYPQGIYEYGRIIIPTSEIVQAANSVVSKNLVLRELAENNNKGTIHLFSSFDVSAAMLTIS